MSRCVLLLAVGAAAVGAQGLLRLDLDAGPWKYSEGDEAARLSFDIVDWFTRLQNAWLGEPTRRPGSQLEWGPFLVDLDLAMALAVAIALFAALVRSLAAERDEKRRLANELETTRTVQQLLVPMGSTAGVDAVHLPANEVGGDFWHFSGERLLVGGGVSGKGLKVSLITALLDRRHADSPGALLSELHPALCQRLDGGLVTCRVVCLEPDGRLIGTNAGHPVPYSGLPLGVVPEAGYTGTTGAFDGALTLVSDGVIDAANATGKLFGFARTSAIAAQSARAIAEAAQQWGQSDDIIVVTVRRVNA